MLPNSKFSLKTRHAQLISLMLALFMIAAFGSLAWATTATSDLSTPASTPPITATSTPISGPSQPPIPTPPIGAPGPIDSEPITISTSPVTGPVGTRPPQEQQTVVYNLCGTSQYNSHDVTTGYVNVFVQGENVNIATGIQPLSITTASTGNATYSAAQVQAVIKQLMSQTGMFVSVSRAFLDLNVTFHFKNMTINATSTYSGQASLTVTDTRNPGTGPLLGVDATATINQNGSVRAFSGNQKTFSTLRVYGYDDSNTRDYLLGSNKGTASNKIYALGGNFYLESPQIWSVVKMPTNGASFIKKGIDIKSPTANIACQSSIEVAAH